MNTDYPTFVFIRHAESEKNLRDITGGDGEHLTNKGEQEAIDFSKRLKSLLGSSEQYNVISSNAIQAIETARQFALQFNMSPKISDELSPAGLGIVGGLSSSQIADMFPDISVRFKAWRNQEIEAVDLQIPDMESPEEFWNRIINFLMKFDKGTNNIIVCTRSVMVLAANLVAGKRPFRGGGYKHISIKNCDTIAFTLVSTPEIYAETGEVVLRPLRCLTTLKMEDDENG